MKAVIMFCGVCLTGMFGGPALSEDNLLPGSGVIESAQEVNQSPVAAGETRAEVGAAPFLVHDAGGPDATSPCSGYIDPRLETLRGADLNVGLRNFTLVFSEEVFGTGGKALGPQDFTVTETGITLGIDESQEPPSGTGSGAFGVGNLAFNEDRTELSIHVVHNLATVTSGHIQRGASGASGPVVFSFADSTSPIDAIWAPSSGDVSDLEAGLLYVNLHSDAFPAGEIRGQIVPNRVIEVDAENNPRVHVRLLRPPSLQEWTTVQAVVENAAGTAIDNQGNLGPGFDEPDRVDFGFLPADVDQDEVVRPLDLLRFRQGLFGLYSPPCGDIADYLDTDRNGLIEGFDLVRFRQLIFGTGPTSRSWAFATTNHPRP